MKIQPQFPPNIGWIHAKLDKNHIDFLWKRIKESKKNNFKHTLAGNISESFEIEDTNNYFLKEVLSKLVVQYRQSFDKDPIRNQNLNDNSLDKFSILQIKPMVVGGMKRSNDEEHAVCNLASIAINHALESFKSHRTWTIYTKEECKYCIWTKRYMDNKGFKYVEKTEFDDDIYKFTNIS